MKKYLTAAVAAAALTGFAFINFTAAHAADLGYYAVKMHADWCGTCQAMKPKMPEVTAALADSNVQFITLDVTNDTRKARSTALAETLGFAEAFKAANGKTGFIAVINAETGAQIAKVTGKGTAAEITDGIQTATK